MLRKGRGLEALGAALDSGTLLSKRSGLLACAKEGENLLVP